MTQTLIEKLEALPRLEMEVQGHKFKIVLDADVQKTIEQAKAEQATMSEIHIILKLGTNYHSSLYLVI